jgi:hypothetical protein
MKKQTKTIKKQWIKPEIQILFVNNSPNPVKYDGVYYGS